MCEQNKDYIPSVATSYPGSTSFSLVDCPWWKTIQKRLEYYFDIIFFILNKLDGLVLASPVNDVLGNGIRLSPNLHFIQDLWILKSSCSRTREQWVRGVQKLLQKPCRQGCFSWHCCNLKLYFRFWILQACNVFRIFPDFLIFHKSLFVLCSIKVAGKWKNTTQFVSTTCYLDCLYPCAEPVNTPKIWLQIYFVSLKIAKPRGSALIPRRQPAIRPFFIIFLLKCLITTLISNSLFFADIIDL